MLKDKDKGCLSRSLDAITQSTFRIIRNTLENNMCSSVIYLFIMLIELFQLLPYILTIGLRVADKTSKGTELYGNFIDLISSVTVKSALASISFTAISIFTYFLTGFFILVIAILLYFELKQTKAKKEAGRGYEFTACFFKYFSLVLAAFLTILVLPIMIMQLTVYRCVDYTNEQTKSSTGSSGGPQCPTCNTVTTTSVFENQVDITCWSGAHLGVAIVNGLNMLIFIVLLIVFETLFSDTAPRSKIPWASTSVNKVKLLKHLFRILVAAFAVFDARAQYYHYFFILSLLVLGFVLYLLFQNPPIINRLTSIATLYTQTVLLAATGLMYIFRICDSVILYIGLGMVLALFLAIGAVAVFAKEKYNSYMIYASISSKSESNKEYYFYQIFHLLDCHSSGEADVAIKLYGIYVDHQTHCVQPNCDCSKGNINRNIKKMKENAENVENPEKGNAQSEYENIKTSNQRSNVASLFQLASSSSPASEENKDERSINASDIEDKDMEKPEDEQGLNLTRENYLLLVSLFRSMIEVEMNNHIGSVALRMISAYYYRDYMQNVFRAAYDFIYIEEKQKPSIREQFLVFKNKKEIEEMVSGFAKIRYLSTESPFYIQTHVTITRASQNELDVETLMKYEHNYEAFLTQAELASNTVTNFWYKQS